MGLTSKRRRDSGMTLMEVLVTLVIVPSVVIAISLGVFAAFAVQTHSTNSVNSSNDIQNTDAVFYKDVGSAMMVTTNSSAVQCGTGTQLLGLEWNQSGNTTTYDTLVSYNLAPNGTTNSLVRDYCNFGPSVTPYKTTILANGVSSQITTLVLLPSYFTQTAGVGWVSTNGITNIYLSVYEPGSNSTFSLNSTPELSVSYVPGSPPAPPTDVVADPLATSATVSWVYPLSSGGAAVTGYTVTAIDATTPANGGQTCTTSADTCDVTGLTEGDSYTFMVTATNSVGTSRGSVPSPSVVAEPPQHFGCTGNSQTFVVPSGVTLIMATTYGAQGGDGATPGGLGGETVSKIHVTPAEVLTINVGCQGGTANGSGGGGVPAAGGWGGGAPGGVDGGGGGGGATTVQEGNSLVEVAGGGGGGGGSTSTDNPGNGGSSGGYTGYNGAPESQNLQKGGTGATPTTGGAGGSAYAGTNGGNGSKLNGGQGGSDGGGGGGGYYGGGGGAGAYANGYAGAGGGGGSSVTPVGGSSAGQANSGDGTCVIDY